MLETKNVLIFAHTNDVKVTQAFDKDGNCIINIYPAIPDNAIRISAGSVAKIPLPNEPLNEEVTEKFATN